MRALLLHCRDYGVKIVCISNRPADIAPEEIRHTEQNCKNCVVALVTVEKNDDAETACSGMVDEITKMCQEIGHSNVDILPFAHLSNNLAKSKEAIEMILLIKNKLAEKLVVVTGHFGSHKELLLDVYGHPGNARYREF